MSLRSTNALHEAGICGQSQVTPFSPSPADIASIDSRLCDALQTLPREDLSSFIPSVESATNLYDLALLFARKCRVCSQFLPSFSDPGLLLAQTTHLLELSAVANSSPDHKIAIFELQSLYQDIISMVAGNIFRSLPRPTYEAQGGIYDPEEDEQAPDPDWPRLQPVYEVFLSWALSDGLVVKVARRVITRQFLGRFLLLFDSEDGREREFCKNILHRLYGRFPSHRIFIRARIYDTLTAYVQETQRHNGIKDFLDLLGPIINGFNIPVKDEHVQMFLHAVMPLHAAPHLVMYFRNLSYCVQQFVTRDPGIAPHVVELLLRVWPQMSAAKASCFLDELQTVLRLMPVQLFTPVLASRVARQIASCCISSHCQVSERALRIFECPEVLQLLLRQRQVVYDILVAALTATARGHWNQAILSTNTQVLRLLQSTDPTTFEAAINHVPERRRAELVARHTAEANYDRVRRMAYENAESNPALLRILCRVDSYVSPSPPSDVHGLGLFGKPVIAMPALEDQSLAATSMKTHVDALAEAQLYLVGIEKEPATRFLGASCAPQRVSPARYDTSLMSSLDLPLRGDVTRRMRAVEAAERQAAAALSQTGFKLLVMTKPTQLAPTLACRGQPTLSNFEFSARVVSDAAESGVVPLSAPVDTVILSENARLVQKLMKHNDVPVAAQQPQVTLPSFPATPLQSTPVRQVLPAWNPSLASVPVSMPSTPLQAPRSCGALSAQEAAQVVSRLASTAFRVSTKHSFSVSGSEHETPVDFRPAFETDIPDSSSSD